LLSFAGYGSEYEVNAKRYIVERVPWISFHLVF
jgi:hypothetical protein